LKKTKENQHFRSDDLLLSVGAIFLMLSLTIPIMNRSVEGEKIHKAKREIRYMSVELMTSHSTFGRDPASVWPQVEAESHLDPWGEPYMVHVLRDEKGSETHLLVWSLGPNRRLDSDFHDKKIGAINFQGDDLGAVYSLK